MIKIQRADFVKSSASLGQCPEGKHPEFAFIGRSNVGKSSLINMILNRSRLAKTSSTPGKTQLINHFLINEFWYIVDLPGYGYARMPETHRKKMVKLARDYILKTKNLTCLFLLIDARLEMQKADREFLEFLGKSEIPFVLVFTKTDKLTTRQLEANTDQFKKSMLEQWNLLPQIFLSSSMNKTGKNEILDFISETLQ